MNGDPSLLFRLLAAQAVLQLALELFARALGRRIPWRLSAFSHLLPWLLLAPWIAGNSLLAPTGALADQIPGAPRPTVESYHAHQLNDVVLQLLPWELEVRHALAAGHLPLWSDRFDGGSSPWLNPQAQVLSPIALLARVAPIQHHLLFALVLKLATAFQGCWLAARAFGVRRGGALVAATGFALGGAMLGWALYSHTTTVAWVAWCFAASIRLVRRPTARIFLATVALYLVLLLSGQPEVAAGGGALAGVVALSLRRRAGRGRRALAHLLLAGVLALALAAPALLPFLEQIPHSARAALLSGGQVSSPPSSSWREAMRVWLVPAHPRVLLAPLTPWAFGVPYQHRAELVEPIHAYSSYAGLAALAGVAVLLFAGTLPRRAIVPLLFVVLILLLTSGVGLLTRLWATMPALGFLIPNRLVPVAGLAMALLGGLGIDRLLAHPRRWKLVAILLPMFVASWAIWPSRTVAVAAALLIGAALLGRRAPKLALSLLLLALLLDQTKWGRYLLPRGEPALFYPHTAEVDELRRLAGGAGGRVVGHDLLLYPNVASVYSLSDPRAHNPLADQSYLDVLSAAFDFAPSRELYFGTFLHPEHPLLDFLGVRVVYSNAYLPEIPGMAKLPLPDGFYFYAVNAEALPRFFQPSGVDRVSASELPGWIRRLRDPRRVAVAAESFVKLAPSSPRDGEVAIVRERPGEFELALPSGGATLLATSIPGPRGWSARAAGRGLPTLAIDGAFLGVAVPAGVELLELAYRPPGLFPGIGLAFLALLAVAGVARRPTFVGLERARGTASFDARARRSAAIAAVSGLLLFVGAVRVAVALDELGERVTRSHHPSAGAWILGYDSPRIRSLDALLREVRRVAPPRSLVVLEAEGDQDERHFLVLWAQFLAPEVEFMLPHDATNGQRPDFRLALGAERAPSEEDAPIVATAAGRLYRAR